MAKKRMVVQFGQGHSIRRKDYTAAAERAVRDALWHNSLTVAEAFGFPKAAMIIDVEIGVQKPEEVDVKQILKVFPYGQLSIRVVHGGLDIPKPHRDGLNIIANAAVIVSFDMEVVK
jgi:uncharacterized protein (TIGR02058 family)